jgi:hypothetical protein
MPSGALVLIPVAQPILPAKPEGYIPSYLGLGRVLFVDAIAAGSRSVSARGASPAHPLARQTREGSPLPCGMSMEQMWSVHLSAKAADWLTQGPC